MSSSTRRISRRLAIIGSVAVLLVAAIAAFIFRDLWRENSVHVDGSPTPAATVDQLTEAQGARVFFGHQSVGENILDAVPGVYAAHGLTAPPISQDSVPADADGGFIVHEYIGENEHPDLKIEDFDKTLRAGLADQVDVVAMKFCFLDINPDTDLDALFTKYRDTISALERDYPDLQVIHITVPLITDLDTKQKAKQSVKNALGRTVRYGQQENVDRETYNNKLRAEYGDAVFDLAAIESTRPDGSRDSSSYRGEPYYALDAGYAADFGHLNAEGSEVAANAFLAAVAAAHAKGNTSAQ